MELLGSYGLLNTVAGAASQLFGASLILAFVRLSQPARKGHSVTLALLLCFSSFSYVIYILAYVGRDGIIYWLMTAFAVYFVFRSHVAAHLRMQIIQAGLFVAILLMIPLFAITKARFIDSDYGIMWSLLDYFGSQLNTFSDYSSIDRPLTYGASNFPMFTYMICKATLIQDCVKWEEVKYLVFDQYLAQGKEPWLFGTYVSDFVGDFGYIGTLILLSSFSSICYRVCNKNNGKKSINIGQLFLIIFLFLVPYWGVFYFRFSIANAFILINLIFIIFVALLQRPFFVSVKKVIRNDKSKFLTSQISSNQSKDKH